MASAVRLSAHLFARWALGQSVASPSHRHPPLPVALSRPPVPQGTRWQNAASQILASCQTCGWCPGENGWHSLRPDLLCGLSTIVLSPRDVRWCWTGVSGWGRVAPQGLPWRDGLGTGHVGTLEGQRSG